MVPKGSLNIQKSIAFLYTSNKNLLEICNRNTPIIMGKKDLKHLVITLTTNVPNLMVISTQFTSGHKSLNRWRQQKKNLF